MTTVRRLALAGLLIPGNVLVAQFAGGLTVGSGVGQLGSAAWSRESRLTPSVRYVGAFSALSLDGTVAERGGAISFDRASVAAVAASPAVGPFRLALDAAYTRDLHSGFGDSAAIAPALSVKHRSTGAWFGSAHERRTGPRLQAGVWTSFRSLVLSLSSRTASHATQFVRVSTFPDSVPNDTTGGWNHFNRTIADTGFRQSRFQWSQLEARLDWSVGRLAVTGSLSASSVERGRDSTSASALMWGRLNASYMINPRLWLMAGAGMVPGTGVGRTRAARFATFGVRFSPLALIRDTWRAPVRPSATAFSVRPVEPGLYTIIMRVPSARSVELSGDFNGWSAVALTQTAPDVWEATLPLAAGTHRINVRVDGDRWTAPPGLPSVNDEFSGRVGILIVR